MPKHSQLPQTLYPLLTLPPSQLQTCLQTLHQQHSLSVLQSMLQLTYKKPSLPKYFIEDRQKLVTSFNFLVRKCFKKYDKNPDLWQLYVQYVLARDEGKVEPEIEEWKIERVFEKSLGYFLESFQEQFAVVMQNVYPKMTTNHKLLLHSCLPHLDIDSQQLTSFLFHSIPSYLSLSTTLFQTLHVLPDNIYIGYTSQILQTYLQSIYQTLKYLSYRCIDNNEEQYFMNKICKSQEIFFIVYEAVFLGRGRQGKEEGREESGKVGKVFDGRGLYDRQECVNKVKALGLEIFCIAIKRFSYKSTLVEFDQTKILNLLQNLIPSITVQLSSLSPKKLTLPETQPLTISTLKLLLSSIPFLFLHSTYTQLHQTIFHQVILPLLIACDQEYRQYKDEPQAFIGQSQTLVQKDQDDQDKVESCKTWAGFLLQKLADYVDGMVTWVVGWAVEEIEKRLEGKIKEGEVEGYFTVLHVLTGKIRKREDLLERIRYIFIDKRQKILSLGGIDKARMILYLCYNFQQIFLTQKQPRILSPHTTQFYNSFCLSLSQPQPTPKSILCFYQTYSTLQPSCNTILHSLISLIPNTKNMDIFQTLTKILSQDQILQSVEQYEIDQIIQKCLERIFRDDREYRKALQYGELYSNLAMIRCMRVLRIIAKDCGRKGEDRSRQIMGKIWSVFDLFQYIQDTNYDTDVLKIYNTILSNIPKTTAHMYQFLPQLSQYNKKHKQLGLLFNTYLALLTKGYQFLTTTQQGKQQLIFIIDNIMIVIRYGIMQSATIAVILLQFVFVKFGHGRDFVGYQHKDVYVKTREMVDMWGEQGQGHGGRGSGGRKEREECVAAVWCLWLLGSSISQEYKLDDMEQWDLSTIYGYNAKLFSISIHNKIHSLLTTQLAPNPQQTLHKLAYLLHKSIKFLQNLSKLPQRNTSFAQKIQQFSLINPYQKIRQSILQVKNKLEERDYVYVMKDIYDDIGKEELRKLVNCNVSDGRVIYKFRTC